MDRRMLYITISLILMTLILLLNIGSVIWFWVAEPEVTEQLYWGMLVSRLALAICLFVTVLLQYIDMRIDAHDDELRELQELKRMKEGEKADDNTD